MKYVCIVYSCLKVFSSFIYKEINFILIVKFFIYLLVYQFMMVNKMNLIEYEVIVYGFWKFCKIGLELLVIDNREYVIFKWEVVSCL